MPSLHAFPTPVNRIPTSDPRPALAEPPPARAAIPFRAEPAPTRVIEIGEVTAGIAVPEGRGVRFFSSSRDFDGLDGTVFGSAEQAARAARALARPGPRGRTRLAG